MIPPARVAFCLAALSVPAASHAQTAQCVVSAQRGTVVGLQVSPADGIAPFTVSAVATTVRATLDNPGPARVHVDASLAFDATHTVADLRPMVARPVDLAGGVVHLAPGTPLQAVRANGSSIDAEIEPIAGVHVPIQVDCARLTFDGANTPLDLAEGRGQRAPFWMPRRPSLRIVAQPGGPDGVDVRVDANAAFEFRALAVRGAWLQMEVRFGHGSRLAGWVAQADVERYDQPNAYGVGGLGSIGAGADPHSGEGRYYGPATIDVATPVTSDRERGAWAIVRVATGFTVDHQLGDPWVAIAEAPGVRGMGAAPRAWVPLARVHFPAGIQRAVTPAHIP